MWTVPWLSWLAVVVLTIATVVLYLVPLRYLILAWGVNKFTKKLRAPTSIPNNELLDYLSRVPSDKETVRMHWLDGLLMRGIGGRRVRGESYLNASSSVKSHKGSGICMAVREDDR